MEIICILCPKGCEISYDLLVGQEQLTGNACPKGAEFARQEWQHPMRTLCTTVMTTSAQLPRLPVKTSRQIPKASLFEAMAVINTLKVDLPVKVGTCLLSNLLDLQVDVVATMTLEEV